MPYTLRPATPDDVATLAPLIARSARALSVGYYSTAQTDSAVRYVFGVDSRLIADGTYFVVLDGTAIVGCGGWSRRRTLYGGDQRPVGPTDLLDPVVDAARIRAFFVDPDHARRGIGRLILDACVDAARAAGFSRLELMATLPGVPLYRSQGFTDTKRITDILPDGTAIEFVQMERPIMAFDRRLVRAWIGATWAGWLLGVPLIVALALVGEVIGVGGAQVLVGAGMGAGIGLMQGRVVRRLLGHSASWVLSCTVGLALPFLITDISNALAWTLPYSLFLAVAAGGLIVGIWQAYLLRPRLQRTDLWIVASLIGWTLAAGTAYIADQFSRGIGLRGIWGALAYLAVVTAGGPLLGIVTGLCLAWMPRRPTHSNP